MRFLRLLPAALFMSILLMPALVALTGFPRVEPLEEFRVPAPLPAWADYFDAGKRDFLGYTRQLNAWYSDGFPTRPFWVRLHTQLRYSLFGESGEVYVGKDGWLFYRGSIDVDNMVLERAGQPYRAQMVEHMAHLSELLAQRGILLYVMPLGLKNRYYPELLPPEAEHARNLAFLDGLLDELQADGRVQVIDTRGVLEEAKRAGLKIFHQTDFHWTDPAGALALKELLNDIAAREGKQALVASWRYDVIDYRNYSGGEARALPLFLRKREDTLAVAFKGPAMRHDVKDDRNGHEFEGVALPGQPPLLAPMLVYGDSFFDAGKRAGMYSLFESYAYSRMFQDNLVEGYRGRLQGTRYLVLEFISTGAIGMDNAVVALIAELEAEPSP